MQETIPKQETKIKYSKPKLFRCLRIGICLSLVSCFLVSYTLFLAPTALAQEEPEHIAPPETLEEGGNFFFDIIKAVPQAVGEIWSREVLPFWGNMYHTYVSNLLQFAWEGVKGLIIQEAEEKQPQFQQELEKEKQELQIEIEDTADQTTQSLWERFKSLFKQ